MLPLLAGGRLGRDRAGSRGKRGPQRCEEDTPFACGVALRAQALFCQVTSRHVLNMFDVSNIWHVPIMLEAQGAHQSICTILGLGGYAKMNLSGVLARSACRWFV